MSAVNRLSAFYAGIKKSKVRTFIAVIAVYTILFALFFLKAAGQTLSDKGHLLGSDGVLQYLPFLVQLRRDLLTFFGSIASGAPALPMVDLNYAFGADTITATAPDFIPMLPYYIFSVFLPENAMPAFITGGVVLMSYLSGLSFTAMCVHFGKDPLFSAVFAPVYVFCADYWLSTWGNPHFLCPFAVFPLMIIGIDRIIQGKSGIMFALAVAFPALGGVHLLVYSMPFVVIFAAIRVYYVHKGAYFRSLGKYFLIGLLYTLLGVMLAILATWRLRKKLSGMTEELGELAKTVDELTLELNPDKTQTSFTGKASDGIQELGNRIHSIKEELKLYTSKLRSQANSMITALSSNYHGIYHIDLDTMEGICYRSYVLLDKGLQQGEVGVVLSRFPLGALHSHSFRYHRYSGPVC